MTMTIAEVPEAVAAEPVAGTFLFEQQRRECDKAFAAFKTYLGLGPERSLVLVAEKHGKSKTMIERWSRRFDWPARVKAHAAHVAEVERRAIERVAVENAVEWWRLQEPTRRDAWKEAEETIAMVRKAREEWLAKGRLPGWEGMARMLELAFKLKQFATGMPNVVKEVNAHLTATIDVDWEIALRKAYGAQESAKCEVRSAKEDVVDIEEVRSPKSEVRSGSESLVTSAPTEGKV